MGLDDRYKNYISPYYAHYVKTPTVVTPKLPSEEDMKKALGLYSPYNDAYHEEKREEAKKWLEENEFPVPTIPTEEGEGKGTESASTGSTSSTGSEQKSDTGDKDDDDTGDKDDDDTGDKDDTLSSTYGSLYSRTNSAIEEQYKAALEQLQQNYQLMQETLADNKRNSQQRASISLDKLRKYLPTQIRQQGLDGLGVSQTAALQANNTYNNQMGEIERDHNESLRDLLSNYTSAKTTLDTARSQGTLSAYQTYVDNLMNLESLGLQKDSLALQQQQYQDSLNRYTTTTTASNQATNYERAKELMDGGYFTTSSELQKYLDTLKAQGQIDADQYSDLSVRAATWSSYLDEQAKTEAASSIKTTNYSVKQNAYGNYSAGDTFHVTNGNGSFKVNSGGEVTDSTIIDAAADVPNESLFGYAGTIYVKHNGKIYSVESQAIDLKDNYSNLYNYIFNGGADPLK